MAQVAARLLDKLKDTAEGARAISDDADVGRVADLMRQLAHTTGGGVLEVDGPAARAFVAAGAGDAEALDERRAGPPSVWFGLAKLQGPGLFRACFVAFGACASSGLAEHHVLVCS